MHKVFDFDVWDKSIQESPEQQQRIERSLTSKVVPLSVDTEKRSAKFNGSGKRPYDTTLTSCTCSDFIRRKQPCKHIYRLAIELGLIDVSETSFKKQVYGNDERTLKDKIKRYIDTLDERSAIEFADYCYKLFHNDSCMMLRDDIPTVIVNSGVFEEIEDDRKKLSRLKKNELAAISDPSSEKTTKLKKDDLISIVLEKVTPEAEKYLKSFVIIKAKSEFKPVLLSFHKYAHKLFPQERVYDWFEL